MKSSLLLHIDGTSPVAEDIGRQVCFNLSELNPIAKLMCMRFHQPLIKKVLDLTLIISFLMVPCWLILSLSSCGDGVDLGGSARKEYTVY